MGTHLAEGMGAAPSALEVDELRLLIYRTFARSGVAPRPVDMAKFLGGSDRAQAALRVLAADRQLALDSRGSIVLAHPFAGRSFGFSVMGEVTLWWGGCAWDSFAIPHLVAEAAVLVATRCGGCSTPIAVEVTRAEAPRGEVVAHFATPMANVWDDVVHACSHQLLYCSRGCLAQWLRESASHEGSTLDLSQLWCLASEWYAGRLEPGYVRREPARAASYFAGCGLTGPFWSVG
jgi:hypothetical protein